VQRANLRANISRATAADLMWLLMDPLAYYRSIPSSITG